MHVDIHQNVRTFIGPDDMEFIENIGDERDVHDVCAKLAEDFGYNYFMITKDPNTDATSLEGLVDISNWPNELVKNYDDLNILESNPIVGSFRRTNVPYYWNIANELTNIQDDFTKERNELLRESNILACVFFSVHSSNGEIGTVSYSGNQFGLEADEYRLMKLGFLSSAIFNKLHTIRLVQKEKSSNLSKREIECLEWTSRGKTSSEIAMIIGLSEHTVNAYLYSACNKLDSVNRVHAVSKAIRRKII